MDRPELSANEPGIGMRTARKSVRWRPALRSDRPGRRYGGIYGETEFKELVLYETARADRTHEDLSLVLCDITLFGGDKYGIGGLIREIVQTVRRTDHVGWNGRNEIGIILTMTDQIGARAFVDKLVETYSHDQLSCAIRSYPESWFANQRISSDGAASLPTEKVTATFTRSIPTWKRAMDIFGSTVGLILLSPLLALVATAIKIVSPGPVFFRQARVGQGRHEFTFLKFRTMHVQSSVSNHTHHLKDLINSEKPMKKLDRKDSRIIPGGHILRRTAIDELPQLINILRGDMSLVGPRPCIPYEADEYQRWHAHRFSIRPGLTGLWQVSGKNKLSFSQMIRLDIAYERHMSFWNDVLIILKTFPTVVGLVIEPIVDRLKGERIQTNVDLAIKGSEK